MVERLNLEVQPTPRFRVAIGNGDSLLCQHKCVDIPIEVQGNNFYLELFVLPIQGPDIILGVQWLQELGRVTHDYATGRMEFWWKKKKVVLKGESPLKNQEISLRMLQSLVHQNQVEEIFEIHVLSLDKTEVTTIEDDEFNRVPQAVREVVAEFKDVFVVPTELPPHRLFQHRIHLQPGSNQLMSDPTVTHIFKKMRWRNWYAKCWSRDLYARVRVPFHPLFC